ncbi:FAD-dependent oxidoreductase [Streptomyces mirabilis]|uniref:FAD-dependent oxidoreductase n=1 Tax=Streptomyces mirabilis TaxID=68239 RepID=UPI0038056FBD
MTARSERSWTDILVIGAGPAGLAVAAGLQNTGLDCLVVEQGPPAGGRDAGNPAHLATGVGGAGLFSDGKFSFYPSATGLWSVSPEHDLRLSYDAMAKALALCGLAVPVYPKRLPDTSGTPIFRQKHYPSFYVPMEERTRLTERLAESVGPDNLLTGTKAYHVGEGPGGVMAVGLRPATPPGVDGDGTTVHCKALVLAGGRFGPLSCDVRLKGVRRTFRRLEMGVRIEQPADDFFLRDQRALDPKFLWDDTSGRYSWRTFCCCRDGRVVATDFDGWVTLSGRADCPPTGRSNVGFNLRVSNESEAALLWRRASLLSERAQPAPWMPLADFLTARGPFTDGTLWHRLGDRGAVLLAEGLGRLTDRLGARRLANALVSGPTLEGVGHYPYTGPELMAAGRPVWAVGDTTGRFRGITAALVSGFFAASRIREYFGRRS